MSEWRKVFHDAYQVSDDGRVQRIAPGKAARVGRVIGITVDANGYARVCLSYRSVVKWFWLHRLVASAFLGDSGTSQVNHLDGNKLNNNLSNLEYVTPKENMQHAIRTGLRTPEQSSRPGIKNGSARVSESDVIAMRLARAKGDTLAVIALRYEITKSTVHKIVTGKTWSHV